MAFQQIGHPVGESRRVVTIPPGLSSQRFAYWDYAAESRELVHRRSGERIALDAVLRNDSTKLRFILRVHDQPWGTAQVLDELVELLGTYFKGERVVGKLTAPQTAPAHEF